MVDFAKLGRKMKVQEMKDGQWYAARVVGVIKDTHIGSTFMALLGQLAWVKRNAHNPSYYQVIVETTEQRRRSFYAQESQVIEALEILNEALGDIDAVWTSYFRNLAYGVDDKTVLGDKKIK